MSARSRHHATARRRGHAWLLAVLGISSACEDATAPEGGWPPVDPPLPAQESPPHGHDYSGVAGVYDLTAMIVMFDSAWGDMTGYRYDAVLTLFGGAPPDLVGSLTDFWLIGPAGDSVLVADEGSIFSTIELGRDVIELKRGGPSTFTLSLLPDEVVPGRLSGGWGCCGHVAGRFEATRRSPRGLSVPPA